MDNRKKKSPSKKSQIDLSETIQSQINEFLRSGNEIQVIPSGISGVTTFPGKGVEWSKTRS